MKNRLALETSPYLLQHAANPVDWYPWCQEAFSKAQQENKIIMLSIGYSTCHWCHVMEKECFEDEEVAKILNKYCVCIKVDREERPDIDNLYMNIATSLLGRGGWPLNVFLTPDKELFYASTYIPKYPREYHNGKIPGILDLIPYLGKLWQEKRNEIVDSAKNIMQSFSQDQAQGKAIHVNRADISIESMKAICEQCLSQLNARFDPEYGGFGTAPKFPSPHVLCFLLQYYKRCQNQEALFMVEKTLKQMRLGGIFDHVGLGFHRYSTDREWILPHFEKMLYDQATLMIAYAKCYEITKDDFYRKVVDEIFQYLNNEMKSPENLFYSAEDADSEGEEGKFYVWGFDELKKILGKEDLEILSNFYNVKPQGNFRDETTGELTGKNILHLDDDRILVNSDTSLPTPGWTTELVGVILRQLHEVRKKRVKPFKDDKILADWNSLSIAALATAYHCTKEKKYLDLAIDTMQSLKAAMLADTCKLYKSMRVGKISNSPASIDDYAYFIWALIELFKAACDEQYINLAVKLTDTTISKFWDESNHGFYCSDKELIDLPINSKSFYDGALPSANSVMASNLFFIYQCFGDSKIKDILDKQIFIMLEHSKGYPSGYAQFMCFLESSFEPFRLACKIP